MHSAVGRIDGEDALLEHTARMGRITGIEAFDVTVQRFGQVAIVSCLQEMHIVYIPDLTPFVVQAAITRAWVPDGDGRLLAHMQLARRQLPG